MLLASLLSVVAPHECLSCGEEGSLICGNCKSNLKPAIPRCFLCHKFSSEWRTCAACRRKSALYAVRVAVRYEDTARDLVWKLKFGRAKSAAKEISLLMQEKVSVEWPQNVFITHVPTATNRVRQRGYDQAALIAKTFAEVSGGQHTPLLARMGHHKQVGATRAIRASQLQEAFRPLKLRRIEGAHIILVDDVITTGATLQEAAATLKTAGAKRVEAVVFAQA